MSFLKRDFGLIAAGTALGITLVFGQVVLAKKPIQADLPLEELRAFSEIFGRINLIKKYL